MDELANDPIIKFYMKMSNSTDSETEVPLYSETMLRLSFKEIFGSMRPIFPKELELYRKLLLLNFSENYTSMSDLVSIMTCFDERTIRECLDDHEEILEEWRTFLTTNLYNVIYKCALNEILYEYTVRYLSIFGEVDDNKLKAKAEEIQRFLRCDEKLPKQWFRSFKALLKNRMGQPQYEQYEDLVEKDLDLVEIYMHVKPRLNIFVVEDLSIRNAQDSVVPKSEEPPTKKSKMSKRQKTTNTKKEIKLEQQLDEDDVFYDPDTDIPIINESDGALHEDDLSCSASFVADTDIKIENNSVEVLQRVDIVGCNENQEDSENDENAGVDGCTQQTTSGNQTIIDYDTALYYLSALQAYAVVNVHFEAIGLLDEVDSMFRQKKQLQD